MSNIDLPETKAAETSDVLDKKSEDNQKNLEVSDSQNLGSNSNHLSPIHLNKLDAGTISNSQISTLAKLVSRNVNSYVTIKEDSINLTFSFPKSEFGQMSLAILQQLGKKDYDDTKSISKALDSNEIENSTLINTDKSISDIQEDKTDMSRKTLNRSFLSEVAYRSDMDNYEEIVSSYLNERDLKDPEREQGSSIYSKLNESGLDEHCRECSKSSLDPLEGEDDIIENNVKEDSKGDKSLQSDEQGNISTCTEENLENTPLDVPDSFLNTEARKSQSRKILEDSVEEIVNVPSKNMSNNRTLIISDDSLETVPERRKSLELKVDPTQSLSLTFGRSVVKCTYNNIEISKKNEILEAEGPKSNNEISQVESIYYKSNCSDVTNLISKFENDYCISKSSDTDFSIMDNLVKSDISVECTENSLKLADTVGTSTNGPITSHKKFGDAHENQNIKSKTFSYKNETNEEDNFSSSQIISTCTQRGTRKLTETNIICNEQLTNGNSVLQDKNLKLYDWPEIFPFKEIEVIPAEEIQSCVSSDGVAKYFKLKLSDRCIGIKVISNNYKEISVEVAEYKKSSALNTGFQESSNKTDNSNVSNLLNQTQLNTTTESTNENLKGIVERSEPLNTCRIHNGPVNVAAEVGTEHKDTLKLAMSRKRTFTTLKTDYNSEKRSKILELTTADQTKNEPSEGYSVTEVFSDRAHSEINVALTDDEVSVSPSSSEAPEDEVSVTPSISETREGEVSVTPSSPEAPEEEISVAPSSSEDPEDEVSVAPSSSEGPEEELSAAPLRSEGPEDEVSVAPSSSEGPEEEISVASSSSEAPEDEVSVAPSSSEAPEDEVSVAPSSSEAPEDEVSVAPSSSEAPVDEVSVAPSSSEDPKDEVSVAPSRSEDPEEEVSVAPSSSEDPEDEVSVAPSSYEDLEKEVSVASSSSEDLEKEVSVAPSSSEDLEKEVSVAPSSSEDPEEEVSVVPSSSEAPEEEASVAPSSSETPEGKVSVPPSSSEAPEEEVSVATSSPEAPEDDDPATISRSGVPKDDIPASYAIPEGLDVSAVPFSPEALEKDVSKIPSIPEVTEDYSSAVPLDAETPGGDSLATTSRAKACADAKNFSSTKAPEDASLAAPSKTRVPVLPENTISDIHATPPIPIILNNDSCNDLLSPLENGGSTVSSVYMTEEVEASSPFAGEVSALSSPVADKVDLHSASFSEKSDSTPVKPVSLQFSKSRLTDESGDECSSTPYSPTTDGEDPSASSFPDVDASVKPLSPLNSKNPITDKPTSTLVNPVDSSSAVNSENQSTTVVSEGKATNNSTSDVVSGDADADCSSHMDSKGGDQSDSVNRSLDKSSGKIKEVSNGVAEDGSHANKDESWTLEESFEDSYGKLNTNIAFDDNRVEKYSKSARGAAELDSNHKENIENSKPVQKSKRADKNEKDITDEVDLAPTRAWSKNKTSNLSKVVIPENSTVTKYGTNTARVSTGMGKTSPVKRILRSKSLDPSPTKTSTKSKYSSRERKTISISGKAAFPTDSTEEVKGSKRVETPSMKDIKVGVRSSPRKITRMAAAAKGISSDAQPEKAGKSVSTTSLSGSARRSKRGAKE